MDVAGGFLKSEISSRIQTASCAALDNAMYSASAVDRATHGLFLALPCYCCTSNLEQISHG